MIVQTGGIWLMVYQQYWQITSAAPTKAACERGLEITNHAARLAAIKI
ncbi:hypothetical protein BLL52_0168 [Rhodoferax antarcticus ANT.BR]|uniref:Uncharacterized protein n=1 Tax=Rhodoferax antarcticus ANT.BR TaxID=1111071 RepID=A0A1Q8YKG4_9BURK|nr:hypothetical protein BLL52_0168 [Rhodoferax antarcticus ANT.BR]